MRLFELAIAVGLFLAPGLQVGSPWPKLQANAQNNGIGTGGGSNGSRRWTAQVPIATGSSPAIAADGTIYVTATGELIAVNPADGSQRWSYPTGSLPGILSSPAIGAGGTVYVTGNGAPLLLAIGPNGQETWQFSGLADGGIYQPTGAPAIAPDGTIYVAAEEFQATNGAGANQNYLFALNPDGSVKWDFMAGPANSISSSPAIGSDGTLYIGASNQAQTGVFFALHPENGHLEWSFTTTGQIVSSPAIGPDGTIYVGEQGGTKNLYSVTPEGDSKVLFTANGSIVSTPAVATDSSLYFPESDGSYYALNSDGSIKWSLPQGTCTSEATVIGSDQTIYFGKRDGHVEAAFQQGTPIWSFAGTSAIWTSLAIGEDGTLYYGLSDGTLVALGTQVDTIPVVGVTIDSTSVVGGAFTTGSVTIQTKAPAGGALVHLASNDLTVTATPFVTISEGLTQATFYIFTEPVSSALTATISASSGGKTVSASFTVDPPSLLYLTLTPTSVLGGFSVTGTVTLFGAAGPGGQQVSLSSNSSSATVPASITVPAGSGVQSFTVSTTTVLSATTATITATMGGAKLTALLNLQPVVLIRLGLAPTSVTGGKTAIGIVAMQSPAPPGGIAVQLTSGNAAIVAVPASVTIASGINAAVFQVSTSKVPSKTTVTLTAAFGFSTKSVNVAIR